MAHCPHCGDDVAGNPEICPSCGQKMALPEPAAPGNVLQPGKYLRTGWELFKQFPGGFVAFTLLFLIIQVILNYLPRVGGFIPLRGFYPPLFHPARRC